MRLVIESSKIALSSILANKIRSSLTILGVVLGVFTIATLLSVALGVRKEITTQIEDLGSNFIAAIPGKISGSGGGVNPSASLGASTLTDKDFDKIAKDLPELKNLSMAMLLSGTLKYNDKTNTSSIVFASTSKILPILNTSIDKGSMFDDTQDSQKAKVVVLGSKAAELLFGTEDSLGKDIEIRGNKLKVIGLLKEKSSAASFFGPSVNDIVILPLQTGWEISNTKQVFRIMMQAPDSNSVKEYKKKVKDVIFSSHGNDEDFSVITQDDALGIVNSVLNILTAMIVGVAVLSLVIGGLGIMNIMLVSITERTKEIGIRKAVGANRMHILVQFLIEAITLSLVGGLLGVVLSGLTTFTVNNFSPLKMEFSYIVILLSLGFSLVVGVVFGVAPALSASRKDPISAIRSE